MRKYFYLKNNDWIKIETWEELCHLVSSNVELINKTEAYFNDILMYENHFLGHNEHKLNGPAFKDFLEPGKDEWYVQGDWLPDFSSFYIKYTNKEELICEYLKIYNYLIDPILILAKHNKWLNENSLEELLITAKLFI